MFLQVHVTGCYRDLLRFLWWENRNLDQQPLTYRMTVHLFGAGLSPGCCNFALKKTAEDYEKELGSEPAEFLRRDFYVDDGLKSVATARDAKKLISKTTEDVSLWRIQPSQIYKQQARSYRGHTNRRSCKGH